MSWLSDRIGIHLGGGAIGSLLGAGLGYLAAPFTGGLSIPLSMAIGGGLGGFTGSAITPGGNTERNLQSGLFGAGSGYLGGQALGLGGAGTLAGGAELGSTIPAGMAGAAAAPEVFAGSAEFPAFASGASNLLPTFTGVDEAAGIVGVGATPFAINANIPATASTLGTAAPLAGVPETIGQSVAFPMGQMTSTGAAAGGGAVGGSSLWPYLAGTTALGTLSNVAGNYMGANQQNENLDTYLNAATWTPEKISAMTDLTDISVLGAYGKTKAEENKTIAGNLASSGRTGGSAESARRALDIATRNAEATAKTNALLQSGAYNPTGLNVGAGAYNKVNPLASSLTGASGTLGSASTGIMTLAMLKSLYPNLIS